MAPGAIASGSSGPPQIPESEGPNGSNRSQRLQRTMQTNQLLFQLQEKFDEIEFLIKDIAQSGTSFELGPGSRNDTGATFTMEGDFINGEVSLNWDAITRSKQKARANDAGTGANDQGGEQREKGITKVRVSKSNEGSSIDWETRGPRVYVRGGN